MRRIGYRLPLGLMMRPARWIVRELPPSPKTYHLKVFFQAAPGAAPAIAWSAGARGQQKSHYLLRPVTTLSQGQTHEIVAFYVACHGNGAECAIVTVRVSSRHEGYVPDYRNIWGADDTHQGQLANQHLACVGIAPVSAAPSTPRNLADCGEQRLRCAYWAASDN